ncbi:MAG: helix-turn-helix domain-containing protein [Armatimonadetes bacterium]|nr:helix-turn-helix domain-containing protein [Armatimonadota bacterium]
MRLSHRMSLEGFAQLLMVSPRTVRSWEEGTREPGAPMRRLLQLLEQQPDAFARIA